jgi:hypothetical protein
MKLLKAKYDRSIEATQKDLGSPESQVESRWGWRMENCRDQAGTHHVPVRFAFARPTILTIGIGAPRLAATGAPYPIAQDNSRT